MIFKNPAHFEYFRTILRRMSHSDQEVACVDYEPAAVAYLLAFYAYSYDDASLIDKCFDFTSNQVRASVLDEFNESNDRVRFHRTTLKLMLFLNYQISHFDLLDLLTCCYGFDIEYVLESLRIHRACVGEENEIRDEV